VFVIVISIYLKTPLPRLAEHQPANNVSVGENSSQGDGKYKFNNRQRETLVCSDMQIISDTSTRLRRLIFRELCTIAE
jgi:hypothetical protein